MGPKARPIPVAVKILLLAVIYIVTARVGQLVAIEPGNVTPVWIPSGIILAAILLHGYRLWPGIFLGASIGNSWAYFDAGSWESVGASILAASFNGAGDALCACLSAYLIRRATGTIRPFGTGGQITAFLAYGVILGPAISAILGVGGLLLGGFAEWAVALDVLTAWAVGDAVGVLLLTPLLLCEWGSDRDHSQDHRREAFRFTILLAVVMAFSLRWPWSQGVSMLHIVFMPLFIWSTLRFSRLFTFAALLAVAVVLTIHNALESAHLTPENRLNHLVELQLTIASIMVSVLYMAAVWSERQKALTAMRTRQSLLENEVATGAKVIRSQDEKLITERKAKQRLEEDIRATERTLATIARNMPESYLSVIERDMTISLAAGRAFAKHGINPADFHGMEVIQVFAIYGPAIVDTVLEHYERAFKGEEVSFDLDVGGEYQTYRVVPLPDDNGDIQRILSVVHDVTERQKLEEELRGNEKLKAIGSLTRGIAHEFNNILTPIKGFTEISLAETTSAEKRKKYLSLTLNATNRASDLIKKMQTYGRQDSVTGKVFDVATVVREALALVEVGLPDGVKLVSHIESDLPGIEGSPDQIHQVLLNLCINANHAMGEQGVLRVTLAREERKVRGSAIDHLLLTVEDNGCGIPEDQINRIFDPFYTTKGVGQGSGLGLSVVHGIIENHRGSITVVSHTGEPDISSGTTFHISLPVSDKSLDTPSQLLDEEGPSTVGDALRLLLIDDEQQVLEVLGAILEDDGHSITTFNDPLKALEAFDTNTFDVVMTDYRMPGMNGLEVIEAIRAKSCSTSIIIMSGFSDIEEKLERKGIDDVVSIGKPFTSHLLKEALLTSRQITGRFKRS